MRARTINGTEVPIEAKPQYIWSLPSPSLKTISIGARVHHSGGLQSAYKNRRKAPDLFLPIITQGFNPGGPGRPWETREGLGDPGDLGDPGSPPLLSPPLPYTPAPSV